MEKSQNEIIKEICKEFNCTQKELAEKLGFSYGAINKWVNGSRVIPKYFFKSIEIIRENEKLKNDILSLRDNLS